MTGDIRVDQKIIKLVKQDVDIYIVAMREEDVGTGAPAPETGTWRMVIGKWEDYRCHVFRALDGDDIRVVAVVAVGGTKAIPSAGTILKDTDLQDFDMLYMPHQIRDKIFDTEPSKEEE